MQLPSFQLERYFSETEPYARYHLCSAGVEPLSLDFLLSLEPDADRQLLSLSLAYPETRGSEPLRQAAAAQYDTLEKNDILIHAGSAEAIFTTINALFTAGDHVIVQFPAYPSLYLTAQGIGCAISYWQATMTENWLLNIQELETLIRPETRGIVLNLPNNPTGMSVPLAVYNRIIALAREHHLILIVDEAYRLLEWQPEKRLPAVADLYEAGISIGGLSKAFALPGLRIGWVATPEKTFLQKIFQLKDYTTICSSTASQFLGTIALKHPDCILKQNFRFISRNLPVFQAFLERQSALIQCVLPEAGVMALPKFSIWQSTTELYERLLQKEGILLLPGKYYDLGMEYFRLGFGRADFPEALARFEIELLKGIYFEKTF